MVKPSRRKRSDTDEDVDVIFERMEDAGIHQAPHRSWLALSFVMYFTIFLTMLPFAVATESFGGNKTHEIKRERRSFEENTSVLSDYMFRRAFRMTRSTFDKLFGMLKTGLENRFLSKGGGKRDPKKSNYIIDLKTRFAVAIRYFGRLMKGGTGCVVGSRILYRRWPITAGVPVAGAHCGERRVMTALEGMIGRCVNSCSGRIQ
jgi:hypothetical protein